MDSASLRRERGVKSTRDGLNTDELLRLSYLESATARAIEEHGLQGNAAILRLHRSVAAQERQTWQGADARNTAPRAGVPRLNGASRPAELSPQAG